MFDTSSMMAVPPTIIRQIACRIAPATMSFGLFSILFT